MAGLIQDAMPPAADPGQSVPSDQGADQSNMFPTGAENNGSTLKNPTLNQIEVGVEENLRPEDIETYQSIVIATMKLALDEKTHPLLLKGLNSSPDMVKNVSLICAGMLGMTWEQTKTDPNVFLPAAIPAAITLMCNILEFAEQTGMTQVTPEMAAQCSSATVKAVFNKFGIDDAKVKEAVESGKAQGGEAAPTDPAMEPPVDPVAQPPMGV